MERIINLGGVPCKMKTSAALPREYRKQFNRDIFSDFVNFVQMEEIPGDEEGKQQIMIRDLSGLENLAYAMHKHGDPAQPDTVEAWLEQFDDPYAVIGAVGEIMALWLNETKTTSVAQKKTGQPTAL